MKNDIKKVYVLSIFIFFTLVFLINVLHPKADFSENENRNLAQFAMPTFEIIKDGSFMTNFENFASDQFAGRDFFISMKLFFEKLQGKKENNGVIFADNDYLIARSTGYDERIVDTNLEAIKKFNEIGRYNVTLTVVPTAFDVLSDYLPKGAYTNESDSLYPHIETAVKDSGINYVDTHKILANHKDEYIYYRTDHHQTATGSYLVYSALGGALGYDHYSKGDFTTECLTEGFYGTNWSKAKVMGIDGDKILKFTLNSEAKYTVDFPLEGKSMDSLYSLDHLKTKDKYSVYLDGNHALAVVRSEAKGGKLAVIKDSYAHSIIPFLANHYGEIHMIDLRYYNDDMVKYLYENKVTNVLVLYNSNNFMSDTNLEKLGAAAETSDYAHIRYGVVNETEPVGNEYFDDAIFIGDSLTGGMSISVPINARFFYSTGMSTYNALVRPLQSGLTIPDAIAAEENVAKIYMMFGINEINEDRAEFIVRYGDIIDRIKSIHPDATIYVQSILPVSEKTHLKEISNITVSEFNQNLEKLAEEKEVYFIKIGDYLCDERGFMPDDITTDGIHMTTDGYNRWLECLKTHAISDGKIYTDESTTKKIEFTDSKIDVPKIAEEIAGKVVFKDSLTEININLLTSLYGIHPEEVLNASIYMGGGATAEEIAVFELKDKETAKTVEQKIQTRIAHKKNDFANYIPQEMAKLNNPLILKNDKLIILCLSDDNTAAEKIIEPLMK